MCLIRPSSLMARLGPELWNPGLWAEAASKNTADWLSHILKAQEMNSARTTQAVRQPALLFNSLIPPRREKFRDVIQHVDYVGSINK